MIKLELFTKEDIPEILKWLESTDAHFLHQFAGPSYHFPLDTEQLTASLLNEDSILFRVVRARKSIGHCQLMRIDRSEGTAAIGRVLLKKEERGKGYGGMIIHELIKYAGRELNLSRVFLNVYEFNTAAVECYKSAGFRAMGEAETFIPAVEDTWKSIMMEYRIEKRDETIRRSQHVFESV